jgi:peptidoglycan/LPS O-acetylase OafA/YrhL
MRGSSRVSPLKDVSEVSAVSKRPSGARATEIDGIRGWASLVVLLFHAFREMLRGVIPEVGNPMISPFFAADLAVSVFFVLSGDALSIGFFVTGQTAAIDRLLVRRYFRLTVPILMSCFLTYLLMKVGLDFHAEAAKLLHNEYWLGKFLHFSPSLYDYLKYSLIKVYAAPSSEFSYNPFLWTMSVEMVGSMLVFLLCYLWPRLRRSELVCISLIVALTAVGSYFSLFFAGMLLSHWRQRGVLDRLLDDQRHQYVAILLVVASIGYYMVAGNQESNGAVLYRLLIPTISMVLVFCAYTQRRLKAFFCGGLSLFLGTISFPVYLLQFQFFISLTSWLIVREHARMGRLDHGALLWFSALTVACTIAASWCFAKLERFALKTADRQVLRILK